ncbi:PAS domain-containing protein [Patescibacteria group bacterium]
MMSTSGTKSKMFTIATGLFVVSMSTVLFLVNEDKLDIHHDEIKTFVIQEEVPPTESEYREIIDNKNDDLLVLGNDTSVEFASDEFTDSLGYSIEEVQDQNFLTLVHPNDIPKFGNALIEETTKQEKSDDSIGPVRLKNSDGDYKPYVISMKQLENEEGDKVSTALVLKNTEKAVGDDDSENIIIEEPKIEELEIEEPEKEEPEKEKRRDKDERDMKISNEDKETEKPRIRDNDDRENDDRDNNKRNKLSDRIKERDTSKRRINTNDR